MATKNERDEHLRETKSDYMEYQKFSITVLTIIFTATSFTLTIFDSGNKMYNLLIAVIILIFLFSILSIIKIHPQYEAYDEHNENYDYSEYININNNATNDALYEIDAIKEKLVKAIMLMIIILIIIRMIMACCDSYNIC